MSQTHKPVEHIVAHKVHRNADYVQLFIIIADQNQRKQYAASDSRRLCRRKQGLFENEMYEGVPELLRSLKDAGVGVYLATSKPTVFSERILDHFGIAEYFDGIVGSELDGHRVDKTEVIRYVLDAYNIPRDSAVMIGDRKFDIAGALAEGIAAVGVSYGYGSRDELTLAGAEMIADSPSELSEILI